MATLKEQVLADVVAGDVRPRPGVLKENGFSIETGVAGIPTAWVARWGSGRPVIALGSDVDCIPQASQKLGVAFRDQIVDGARGTARVTTRARRSTSWPPWP